MCVHKGHLFLLFFISISEIVSAILVYLLRLRDIHLLHLHYVLVFGEPAYLRKT